MNIDDDFNDGKGQEIDIADILEQDNVEYERKNAKHIKISVIPEPVFTEEEKKENDRKLEEWAREGREEIARIEKEIKEGKSNFGKIMVSDSLKQLLKGE